MTSARYLPSFPYQDNPILHLYAGMICFHLANHVDHEGNTENLLSQAKGHVERSLALKADDPISKAFLEEVRTIWRNKSTAIHSETQITNSLDTDRDASTEGVQDQGSDNGINLDTSDGAPTKRKRLENPSS